MIEITSANYEQEVVQSDIPVVLDFWAPWCGYCKQLMPSVEELAGEYEGKVKFGKVNVDDEQELAIRFGIMSIPVCAKLEGGEMKARTMGFMPKEELKEKLGL